MKLLIISNMAHYYRDGQIVGHGPTAREINDLATLFDEVRHVACLYQQPPSKLDLPYTTAKIHLVPLPPAGGRSLRDKLNILLLIPLYIRTMMRELPKADVVHVRCPANIPLLAIILLALIRHPKQRWIKYAGNWQPQGREACSYTFQRWWLTRNFARAKVTVNGHWQHQPEHIHTFLNPCLTEQELMSAEALTQAKRLTPPYRFVFVGRVEAAKGLVRAFEIVSQLVSRSIPVYFDIIGDGAERPRFEQLASELGIQSQVKFHGWLPRPELESFYAQAHIMLFPSNSEGWPKVISESMAYGVVPLAGAVSSIPEYLQAFSTGKALAPENTQGFVDAVQDYLDHPDIWKAESQNAVRAARQFSYANYLVAVKQLLTLV